MWPFKNRTPAEAELTNVSYQRWLRAHRPQPLSFFLALDEAEQATLAQLGDDYVEDCCIALGYAIHNPDAAAMGLTGEAGEEALEEALAARLGADLVSGAARPPGSPQVKRPLSMGGVTERRAQRSLRDRKARDEGRRFLGRRPDPIKEVAP